MLTSAEVEAQFRYELNALLEKWGATISADDHYSGYPECGSDIRMTVEIPAVYDKVGEPVQERAEIDLGKYL